MYSYTTVDYYYSLVLVLVPNSTKILKIKIKMDYTLPSILYRY